MKRYRDTRYFNVENSKGKKPRGVHKLQIDDYMGGVQKEGSRQRPSTFLRRMMSTKLPLSLSLSHANYRGNHTL